MVASERNKEFFYCFLFIRVDNIMNAEVFLLTAHLIWRFYFTVKLSETKLESVIWKIASLLFKRLGGENSSLENQ